MDIQGRHAMLHATPPAPSGRRPARLRRPFLAGAAILAAIGGAALPAAADVSSATANTNNELYRKSIADAAVKRPSFQLKLKPIDASQARVKVITLTYKKGQPVKGNHPFSHTRGRKTIEATSGDKGVLKFDTWVSQPSESSKACKGAKDPVLALEQILGMPPAAGDWELVQFEVEPKHIFRPCASSPDITTSKCDFALPTKFKSKKEKEAVEAVQAFVFAQMWSSFNVGFPSPGYPFTGMGWTYNWSPDSEDHYGISEYVVKQGAKVHKVRNLTPKQFCNG